MNVKCNQCLLIAEKYAFNPWFNPCLFINLQNNHFQTNFNYESNINRLPSMTTTMMSFSNNNNHNINLNSIKIRIKPLITRTKHNLKNQLWNHCTEFTATTFLQRRPNSKMSHQPRRALTTWEKTLLVTETTKNAASLSLSLFLFSLFFPCWHESAGRKKNVKVKALALRSPRRTLVPRGPFHANTWHASV